VQDLIEQMGRARAIYMHMAVKAWVTDVIAYIIPDSAPAAVALVARRSGATPEPAAVALVARRSGATPENRVADSR